MRFNDEFLDRLRKKLPEFYRLVYGEDPEAGQVRCPDPKHDDENPSAGMVLDNRGNPRIHCFGCGGSWDIFALAGLKYPNAISFPDQVLRVANELKCDESEIWDNTYIVDDGYKKPRKNPGQILPFAEDYEVKTAACSDKRKETSTARKEVSKDEDKTEVERREDANENEQKEYDFTSEVEKAHQALFSNEGVQALAYFRSRGLSDEMIRRYKLGYCPNGINECLENKPLLQKRKTKKYKEEFRKDPLTCPLNESPAVKGYQYLLPNPDDQGGYPYIWHEISDRKLLADPNTGKNIGGKYNKLYSRFIENRLFNERYLKRERPPLIVVICEGFYDALSVEQVSENVKAMALIGVGQKQIEKLCRGNLEALKNTCFVIALDSDNTGQERTKDVANMLTNLGLIWIKEIPEGGKDFNEMLQKEPDRLAEFVRQIESHAREALKNSPFGEIESLTATASFDEFTNRIENPIQPIDTGFDNLNGYLNGGLRPGLIGVGAISSLGKTAFVLQIADQIAERTDTGVLIFSLEMAKHELMARTVSRLTYQMCLEHDTDTRNAKTVTGILDWNSRNHSKEEIELLGNSLGLYRTFSDRISIYEAVGTVTANDIREKAELYRDRYGKAPVIVVDYLQILQPDDPKDTEKRATDKNVMLLKQLSRDLETPVIIISSFNRQNYSQAVSFESFKESGGIEYSTDVLIGLQLSGTGTNNFNVDEAKKANPRQIEAVLLKNRQGRTGIKMEFDYYPAFNCFEEIEE